MDRREGLDGSVDNTCSTSVRDERTRHAEQRGDVRCLVKSEPDAGRHPERKRSDERRRSAHDRDVDRDDCGAGGNRSGASRGGAESAGDCERDAPRVESAPPRQGHGQGSCRSESRSELEPLRDPPETGLVALDVDKRERIQPAQEPKHVSPSSLERDGECLGKLIHGLTDGTIRAGQHEGSAPVERPGGTAYRVGQPTGLESDATRQCQRVGVGYHRAASRSR